MSRSRTRASLVLLSALALGAPALGQGFNIDLGGNQTFGVPANTYGAAALQPGEWNDVQTFASFQTLIDLTGASTAVTFTDLGTGVQDYESDNAGTSGDDEALMDDFTDLGCAVGDATAYTISGLADGDYQVYTYAWASDGAGFRTDISVAGSSDPTQSVGGDWTGSHVLGVTYASHRVTVAGGSDVDIQAVTTSNCGSVNGFQLVPLGAGDPIGSSYCGPANLNSSGQAALLTAFGSDAVVNNSVRLDASQMATNQFGFFLNSTSPGFVLPPGSQGNLCLSGGIGRYNKDIMNSGAAGEFSLQLDLTDTPTPGGPVAIQPGETWYFQAWFRDNNPGPTSNFTDGVSIAFQ